MIATTEPSTPTSGGHRARLSWRVAIVYLALFLLLDWVSYIRPLQGFNITPWNPQPALAIGLLMHDRRWLGLVVLGLFGADIAIRGWPADWLASALAWAGLALVYLAASRELSLRLDPVEHLRSRGDLGWFTGLVVLTALCSGLAYVTIHVLGGQGPSAPFFEAVLRFWVGEVVGLIVVLPLVLSTMAPAGRQALGRTLRSVRWWMIAALMGVILAATFSRSHPEQFRYFYLMLLPVIWAAVQFGLAGAILCAFLTQVALIAAIQWTGTRDLTVFELQALMAVITMTGLVVGVAVDERQRAFEQLRRSLRLAAAGQMAAALAHELSQPLTALSGYAQACQALLSAEGPLAEPVKQRLEEVARRIVGDAHRASDVIKRLRDFFRDGTTQLRPTRLHELVLEMLERQASRAKALQVDLSIEAPESLPQVWVDPIQVAVVLRNLIDNAMEAAAQSGAPRRVVVALSMAAGEQRVEVRDSGPGVSSDQLVGLFEFGSSNKPGGMGVGLSICRAICEAHGGRLWAEAGRGGRFGVAFPVEPGPEDDRHGGDPGGDERRNERGR